jgi:hypothetical protein
MACRRCIFYKATTTFRLLFALAQVEGGVIVAPLILHGALVVAAVRFAGFLKKHKAAGVRVPRVGLCARCLNVQG